MNLQIITLRTSELCTGEFILFLSLSHSLSHFFYLLKNESCGQAVSPRLWSHGTCLWHGTCLPLAHLDIHMSCLPAQPALAGESLLRFPISSSLQWVQADTGYHGPASCYFQSPSLSSSSHQPAHFKYSLDLINIYQEDVITRPTITIYCLFWRKCFNAKNRFISNVYIVYDVCTESYWQYPYPSTQASK